jgi:hypothetical protein
MNSIRNNAKSATPKKWKNKEVVKEPEILVQEGFFRQWIGYVN